MIPATPAGPKPAPLPAPMPAQVAPAISPDLATDLEACIARYEAASPNKSFASADGWSFLINDSNDFLRWQFGLNRWQPAQLQDAVRILDERRQHVARLGAQFAKFIVPEKSAIYSRYLPGLLGHAPLYDQRPANLLHRAPGRPATYLYDWLTDLGKLGLTYLRGDSHPNWQGSYLAYLAVHQAISAVLPISKPLALHELVATATSYGGDLFGQLPVGTVEKLPEVIRLAQPPRRAETLIEYAIDPARRRATPGPVAEDYVNWFDTRETLVWNNADRTLPRIVIFRDSTATRFLDYIAEHFSRTVAVWWHGVIVEDVIAREKPDFVLQVQAERFLQLVPTTRPIVKMAEMQAAFAMQQKRREEAAARAAEKAAAEKTAAEKSAVANAAADPDA